MKKKGTQQTKTADLTAAQWLIQKYNTKDWRIGKVSGWKHEEITQDVIDLFGKQELIAQIGELERS